jgi:hypothetical protein
MKGHYVRNSTPIKTQNGTCFQDGPFYTLVLAFECGVFTAPAWLLRGLVHPFASVFGVARKQLRKFRY